jgi:hypothetical protein
MRFCEWWEGIFIGKDDKGKTSRGKVRGPDGCHSQQDRNLMGITTAVNMPAM